MQRKILFVVCLCLVSVLGGCAKPLRLATGTMIADIEARLIRVRFAPPRQVIEFEESTQYEDNRILVRWKIASGIMLFTITNKGQANALKILWDEVVFSDFAQVVYDVEKTDTPRRVPEGATAIVGFSGGGKKDVRLEGFSKVEARGERGREVKQVRNASGTRHYSLRIPQGISLDEEKPYEPKNEPKITTDDKKRIHQEAQEWIDKQLQAFKEEVESYNGKAFSILIPMLDAGKEIEYLFTFRLRMSFKDVAIP